MRDFHEPLLFGNNAHNVKCPSSLVTSCFCARGTSGGRVSACVCACARCRVLLLHAASPGATSEAVLVPAPRRGRRSQPWVLKVAELQPRPQLERAALLHQASTTVRQAPAASSRLEAAWGRGLGGGFLLSHLMSCLGPFSSCPLPPSLSLESHTVPVCVHTKEMEESESCDRANAGRSSVSWPGWSAWP